ncbi:MAG: hypothetical protein ABGX22_16085 [Pirellulaceae bacterium]
MNSRPIVFVCLVLFHFGVATAAPTVTQISPRGLTAGGSTMITLRGTELDRGESRLISPLITRQTVVKATAGELQFRVEVAAEAICGLYRFRVANEAGISNAWIAGVDTMPQLAFQESIAKMPTTLSGMLTGGNILQTRFQVEAGMELVAEVECRRLGGQARPVLQLLDPRGVQISWGRYRSAPQGDARLSATAPVSGEYTLLLHDLVYKAPASPFRLKVGSFQYATMTFPLAVQTAANVPHVFVDTNIETPPMKLWNTAGFPGIGVASPQQSVTVSGPLPQVVVSGYPEWIEGSEGALPSPPLGINGRIDEADQVDLFRVPVTAGQTLRFKVLSHRVGSRLDPVLTVRDVKGKVLGQNDDNGSNTDAVVQVKIANGVSEVDVEIRDVTHRGSLLHVYRIAVEPVGNPEFSLKIVKAEINIPDGARQLVLVAVQRRGYGGPINLSTMTFDGGKSNVEVENPVIPPGATQSLVMLHRTAAVAESFLLRGQGEQDGRVIASLAQVDTAIPQDQVVPGASHDLAVSTISATPVELSDLTIPNSPHMGQQIALPLEIKRLSGGEGPIRIRLISNQPMPKKKIKVKNKDQQVDDVDRTLRVEGETMWGADKSTGTVQLQIPTDLPAQPWQVALAAELLSADSKKVLATAYASVNVLQAAAPFRLELSSAAEIKAVAGEGEAGKLIGIIHRRDDFDTAVQVTIKGLPDGYQVPNVEVPAGKSNFELSVAFTDKAKPAKLEKLQLIATWAPNAKKPQQTFASNPIAVVIDVTPSAKTENDP